MENPFKVSIRCRFSQDGFPLMSASVDSLPGFAGQIDVRDYELPLFAVVLAATTKTILRCRRIWEIGDDIVIFCDCAKDQRMRF